MKSPASLACAIGLAATFLWLPGAGAQILVDVATDATDPFDLSDTEPSIAVQKNKIND